MAGLAGDVQKPGQKTVASSRSKSMAASLGKKSSNNQVNNVNS